MAGRDPVQASKVTPKKVKWLWKDRLPEGKITVVAGKPDQGKGLLACRIAADVTKAKGNVLYSAIEDDHEQMTRPRLEAAGADLDRVLLWRFQLPGMFKQLEQRIVKNKIRLVIMDPLAGHVGGGVSRFSDSIRLISTPLEEIGAKYGCTFLIVDHMIKRPPKNSDPLNAISGGGSGLTAAARMGYLYGKDPKDSDKGLMACVKSNLREKPKTLVFEFDVEELDVVGDVGYLLQVDESEADASVLLEQVNAGTPGRPPDKRADAAEWLARYLFKAGKKVKAKLVYEDAKQFGLSTKTVRRAADDMGVVKVPPTGGAGCTWDLNPVAKKAMKEAAKVAKSGGAK